MRNRSSGLDRYIRVDSGVIKKTKRSESCILEVVKVIQIVIVCRSKIGGVVSLLHVYFLIFIIC